MNSCAQFVVVPSTRVTCRVKFLKQRSSRQQELTPYSQRAKSLTFLHASPNGHRLITHTALWLILLCRALFTIFTFTLSRKRNATSSVHRQRQRETHQRNWLIGLKFLNLKHPNPSIAARFFAVFIRAGLVNSVCSQNRLIGV